MISPVDLPLSRASKPNRHEWKWTPLTERKDVSEVYYEGIEKKKKVHINRKEQKARNLCLDEFLANIHLEEPKPEEQPVQPTSYPYLKERLREIQRVCEETKLKKKDDTLPTFGFFARREKKKEKPETFKTVVFTAKGQKKHKKHNPQ